MLYAQIGGSASIHVTKSETKSAIGRAGWVLR
jgi:hypothetical protein